MPRISPVGAERRQLEATILLDVDAQELTEIVNVEREEPRQTLLIVGARYRYLYVHARLPRAVR